MIISGWKFKVVYCAVPPAVPGIVKVLTPTVKSSPPKKVIIQSK